VDGTVERTDVEHAYRPVGESCSEQQNR
jgi:hypothetical protein